MGDELVKSEQSTLHLCDSCARKVRRVRQGGGSKKFFQVLLFTLFTFHFYTVIS